jgi:LuxR family maltose regulon positive regulatory protein
MARGGAVLVVDANEVADGSTRSYDRAAIPALPAGVVHRPRLFELLNAALDHSIITVTGPAGWGKTQLLASWATTPEFPAKAAWLTIERSDADPLVFWPAVMAAVSRTRDHGSVVEHDVDSDAPVVEALLGVEHPVVLVLDDVHLLQGSPVAPGLARLARMLPPQVHLVLSGQFLPDLPLAKLRVERKLVSLTGRDLAFTSEEAVALLAESGTEVPRQVAVALRDRTEGWSAGLRLAALTLLDGLPADELLGQFGGDHVEVADYLMSEVISRQPPDVQDFLLRTAVCERINGELAAALTGRTDSAELLRWMAAHNVFTTSDGPRQTWFRYHTMLSELLRSRLEVLGPEEERQLHAIASRWFAEHDMPVQAFDHAARADDWERAAAILMDLWLPMYLDGKLVSLGELIDRLPRRFTMSTAFEHIRTAVGLALGDARLSPGEGALAGAGFDTYTAPSPRSEDAVAAGTPGHGARTVPDLVVSLERARLAGDLDASVAAARQLVELAGSDELRSTPTASDLRALAFQQLGMTEYWAGRREEAEAHLREALAEAAGNGREYVQLGCLVHLVLVLTVQNRLTEGLKESDVAVALIGRRGWEITGAAAEVWHALGWVAYLRGDLDLAEKHLEGAALAVRRQDAAVVSTVLLVRGLAAALRGRKREAIVLLDEAAEAMSRIRGHFVFDDYVVSEQARLRLAIGDVEGGRAVLAPHAVDPHGPVHVTIAHAELRVCDGSTDEAIALLLEASRAGRGLIDQHLQALVLLALLQARTGDEVTAARTIAAAVDLAAPERYIQPFIQFGRPVGRLLRTIVRRTDQADFIEEILSCAEAFWPVGLQTVLPSRVENLDEQPTERELEVLRALDSHDSLPEISDSLFISVNTLKAHLRSLYRKLAVRSRREAVAKARSLGLL